MKRSRKKKDIQKTISQEKKNVVNQIVTMYPILEKDKKKILNNILSEKIPPPAKLERVFVKVKIDENSDEMYFRDNTGWLWQNTTNNECKVVGAYKLEDSGEYKYYLF